MKEMVVSPVTWVAIGGSLGSVGRYGINLFSMARWGGFPYGTLIVNIVGIFVLGFLAGLLGSRQHLPAALGAFIGVGFCGGLTTFSTYSLDPLRLAESGKLVHSLGNMALNNMLAILAGTLGSVLAREFFPGR